jgi:CHAT domain-containing protein/Tfp pilus assembly protein PilF
MKYLTIATVAAFVLQLTYSIPITTAAVFAQNSVPDNNRSLNEQAEQLYNEASDLYLSGDRQGALDKLNQALLLYRQIGARTEEAVILNSIGVVHRSVGQLQQALEYFNQALLILQQVGDRVGEASTLDGIGSVYAKLGQPQQALEYFEQSLPISQEVGDRAGEATTLNNIGFVHVSIGQLQQALEYFNQALPIQQELGDRAEEAKTLGNVGYIYAFIEQPQRALEFYNQALLIFQEVGDRAGEATTLNNIGEVSHSIGQRQQALEIYNQALLIFQEVGDRAGEAATLNNTGFVHASNGQPQQAMEIYNQALLIFQEVGDRAGEATTLNNIGEVNRFIGKPQRALEFYNRALLIFQEVGARVGEATTLTNIGAVYRSIGQPQQAIDLYNQALPIQQEVGNRVGEATTLNNIGFVYDSIDQSQQALEVYNQALAIRQEVDDRHGEAITLSNIGSVYAATAQLQQALEVYNQALAIRQEVDDRHGEAITLSNIGFVYASFDQPQKALEFYNQSLQILQEVDDRNGTSVVLGNTGFIYENQGNLTQAIDYYQQSISITEAIQGEIQVEELKSSFAGGQSSTYARLINLLVEQGGFTTAFNYAERAKARAFLDQLANGQVDFRSGADASLLQQEQDLRTQITATQTQLITLNNRPKDQQDEDAITETTTRLDSLRRQYADLLTRIKLQSPETASLVTVDVAPLEEIQGLLEPDTTLIEYFVTDDRTFAFLLTRDSFNTIPIEVTQAELTEQIQLLLQVSFADPELDDAHPVELQQLHEWLIVPLQAYLSTDRLIVVPHGILHYLPFTALTDGNQYLSQDSVVSLLPSANVLRYLPQHHDTSEMSLMALGNPTIPDRQLTPLNYAQAEVETIAALFNTQPLVNSAATESAIWTDGSNANILHLAVHGEYNPINPLFSTLHLASDTQHDGRLEVHEIFGLNLTNLTNLVVLSACETSIGELSQGDEIVGLNRAFLYAGTPAVMTSLWNVDDAATGMLMEQFYTQFKNGMSATEALQYAQQTVRAEYPHPYFWSAFSITGR